MFGPLTEIQTATLITGVIYQLQQETAYMNATNWSVAQQCSLYLRISKSLWIAAVLLGVGHWLMFWL